MTQAVPPVWETRVRAPSLTTFSLLGRPVCWADSSSRVALLADLSGRVEVHVVETDGDAPQEPRRITDREQGTTGLALSPDGGAVFWFDDDHGSEFGRWVRHRLDDGHEATLLPDLDPAYGSGGFVALGDGGAVVGRLVESGLELGVAGRDGTGRVAYRTSESGYLVDATPDGSRALLAVAPGGDWLHLGARVVDLASGSVVGEVAREGDNLTPVAFRPDRPEQVLLAGEVEGTGDRIRPLLWEVGTDRLEIVEPGLDGDVEGQWYPSGDALLVSVLREARHALYRCRLDGQEPTLLASDLGVVWAASPRPDGSVEALVSRSDRPASMVRLVEGPPRSLVRLAAEPPAAVRAEDVFATGPQGRVHGLVYRPTLGEAPYPTVFVVHGGPTGQDFDAWNTMGAAYNDLGYLVVRVNYRGSTGYGARWRDALHRRLGFIELEDVDAVRRGLEAEGVVDPDRVSIAGGSWGGFLTLMALGTQPDRWRSGAALVPLADWFTNAEHAPSFMQVYDCSLFGGSIEEIPDAYRASSPITYADAVTAPVFVTAGERDPRCPVAQVDSYVEALRARGHDVRYDRIDTGHGLPAGDMLVRELGTVLAFLQETNPV
jgi:dipeptidyl aminopeptidase/acylaminoacyl peptidase